MRPRRFPEANVVYRLPGGNEDTDLWIRRGRDTDEDTFIESVWEPNEAERAAIAAGGTIELRILGEVQPPVSLAVGPPLADRKAAVA